MSRHSVAVLPTVTRIVNLASYQPVNYNPTVPTQRILALIPVAAMPFLLGAACTKESKSQADNGAVGAMDRAGSGSTKVGGATVPPGPVDTTPLPGIEIDKLSKKQQDLFYKLVGSLPSPCGKAHSLRTSVTSDQTCKRAPFAARLVAAMIEDEAKETDVREEYNNKYLNKTPPKSFKLEGVAYMGTPDAPIQLVEFYDYACPACQQFKPEVDQVIQELGSEFVIYYKQFPLVSKHPDSHSAAQAALAAQKQDKFKEMHDTLFQRAPAHKRDEVIGYAKELGLDLAKFTADYDALAAEVDTEQAEGDAAGVDHTPTLFFNGVEYTGPHYAKYLAMWIEEEAAVNR
jgi:protein-disulfide isomerase